ncbi:MAG: hypothetical protein E7014_03265 [Alphaproteobacteria bacterium]|nr:hypothetical protein [Alphaproteobacteria bacterium]
MFKIKLNETGRSMVEMLGVLAIIGVLSVAGVATYQYALTAYQAGKVQDVLGKAKTLAQTDSRASHALEVNRFIKSALSEYVPDDKKSMVKLVNSNYQVTTFKVVYKVCEKLLQKEGILNDMGISILTRTCGNPNSKTNMVFSFNAIPVVNSDSHFGGTTETETDNPNIEPQSCPDKMVWRQKEDGTYGCVCRHEYEFGDNCERCYPPKEWFEDETTCRCPDMTPVWHNEECVECIDDSTCQIPNLVCDTSNNTCKSCPDERPFYNVNSTNPDKCEKCPDATPVFAVNTNECIACPSSAPYWNGKECSPNECESNDDCHKLYNNDTNYFCTRGDNICETGTFSNARCEKLDFITFKINGVNFYFSKKDYGDGNKGWESAINFCTALGKQMVSVPDLGCTNNLAIDNQAQTCSGYDSSVYKIITTNLINAGYSSGPWITYNPWSQSGNMTCQRACFWLSQNKVNTHQSSSTDYHGGPHYALCRDWGPMCFAPYTREGDKCVCPTGTYDTGTTCATCTAPYIINATQTGCTCPTGSHDNGRTCITCPEGATWNDEHKACAVTVSIETGGYYEDIANHVGTYSLTKGNSLIFTFPTTITTGVWQLIGTNQKADISTSVQLGSCPRWSGRLTVTNNQIILTNTTISNFVPVHYDQDTGCYDNHGQHLLMALQKPKGNQLVVLAQVNTNKDLAPANTFYASIDVFSSTAQAILIQ